MKNLVLSLVFCALLVSCTKRKDSSPIVSTVGNSRLTLAEARSVLLKSNPADVDLENIITRWVDDELLYQAALQSKLNKDKTIRKAVKDYERRLLGRSYLNALIQKKVVVTPSEIEEYYHLNSGSFLRSHNEAIVIHFLAQTEKEAWNIRTTLKNKGTNSSTKELLDKYSTLPTTVRELNLIQALDRPVFKQKKRGVVGPIQTGAGYHVIHILEYFPKGSLRNLVEVYDEIQQRLIRHKSIIIAEQVLDSLRHAFHAEILLEGSK